MRYLPSKGKILNEQAYARGKMLNHELWYGVLPRNITPSDIDAVIDNNGIILFIEFSSKTASWNTLNQVSRGQYLLYRNLVFNGQGKHIAALAYIKPEPNKQINTVTDVIEFSLMMFSQDDIKTSKVFAGKFWQAAVKNCLALTD